MTLPPTTSTLPPTTTDEDTIDFLLSLFPSIPHLDCRPHVTLTFAQSLDGFIARPLPLQTSTSSTSTSSSPPPLLLSTVESLKMTHRMRSMHDGIMVGIETVLADDPQLNVRHIPLVPVTHQLQSNKNWGLPQPIVLDTRLRLPITSRLVRPSAVAVPRKLPWVVVSAGLLASSPVMQQKKAQLEAMGVRVIPIACSLSHGLDLDKVLSTLHTPPYSIQRLMVEGGAKLIQSFLRRPDLVHRVVITVSPRLLGEGVHATQGVGALKLDRCQVKLFGEDVVIAGSLKKQSFSM